MSIRYVSGEEEHQVTAFIPFAPKITSKYPPRGNFKIEFPKGTVPPSPAGLVKQKKDCEDGSAGCRSKRVGETPFLRVFFRSPHVTKGGKVVTIDELSACARAYAKLTIKVPGYLEADGRPLWTVSQVDIE